jgi:sepiapterin reductase
VGKNAQHLWARSASDLQETERLVQEAWCERTTTDRRTLRTFVTAVDLALHSDYAPRLDALLGQLQEVAYDRVYVVHNAGSLGHLCFSHEWASHEQLTAFWELNVTSLLWLNKRFLDVYGASREQLTDVMPSSPSPPVLTLLNITSLCAIEPFSTHGLYCTSKAAREMHLRVISKEQPATKVRVLSYSPGPMDTDMQKTIRESPRVDRALGDMYATMHAEGRLIPPAVSSRLGVQLTLSDAFENGAHVDYYDIAPPTADA